VAVSAAVNPCHAPGCTWVTFLPALTRAMWRICSATMARWWTLISRTAVSRSTSASASSNRRATPRTPCTSSMDTVCWACPLSWSRLASADPGATLAMIVVRREEAIVAHRAIIMDEAAMTVEGMAALDLPSVAKDAVRVLRAAAARAAIHALRRAAVRVLRGVATADRRNSANRRAAVLARGRTTNAADRARTRAQRRTKTGNTTRIRRRARTGTMR